VKRVFVLHLIANAALIALLYVWLGIRDARAWQILITVMLGAVIVSAAVYLHAGTWHWMRARDWRVPPRTLLRFAGGLLLFAIAAWLLSLIPVERAGLWTASMLTFKSRKPVNPDTVQKMFGAAMWLLTWFVLPVVLFGKWRRWRFWLLWAAVLLVSWYVPRRLVHWTPDFKSTAAEVTSLMLRWGTAYLLAIAGWLTVLRESSPVQSQK